MAKKFTIAFLIPLFLSLLASIIFFYPMVSGIPQANDLPDHLAMTSQFIDGLREGRLYPRWLPDMNDGFGEPTFIYYPPGLSYLAAPIAWALGGDVLGGLLGALFLASAVGFAGIYFLVRPALGPMGGAIAVAAFAAIPYRIFEIYAAGLYSAYAAGCLLPWALLALWRAMAAPSSDGLFNIPCLLWAAVAAGMIMVNLPLGVMVGYVALFSGILEWAFARNLKGLLRSGVGFLGGALLASVYLIPAVLELPWIERPHSGGPPLFESNFVFQAQGSWMSEGLRSVFDRMAAFPAIGFGIAAAVVGLAWIFRRRGGTPSTAAAPPGTWLRLLLSFGLLSLFLATPLSAWVWRKLPLLGMVNLPWRFLDPFAAPAAALLASALLATPWDRPLGKAARVVLVLSFSIYLLISFEFGSSLSAMNGDLPAASVRALIPEFRKMKGYFRPKGAGDLTREPALPTVRVARGEGKVEVREWSPSRRRFWIEAETEATVALRTYGFPGWVGRWRSEAGTMALPVTTEAETGRILVQVDAGSREVEVSFESTPPRIAGALVSAMALLALLLAGGEKLAAAKRARERKLHTFRESPSHPDNGATCSPGGAGRALAPEVSGGPSSPEGRRSFPSPS